jgi:hypothetical protein
VGEIETDWASNILHPTLINFYVQIKGAGPYRLLHYQIPRTHAEIPRLMFGTTKVIFSWQSAWTKQQEN